MFQTLTDHSAVVTRQSVETAFTRELIDALTEDYLGNAGGVVLRAFRRAATQAELDDRDLALRQSYALPGDADGQLLLGYNGLTDMPDSALSDISNSALVEALGFVRQSTIGDDPLLPGTQRILDELGRRITNDHVEIAEFINARRSAASGQWRSSPVVQALTPVHACALAESFDLTAMRRRLASAAKQFLRRCIRSGQDGTRVSREVHEYNYCISSGQILDALRLVAFHLENNDTANADIISAYVDNVTVTYGEFVDWTEGRKLIAQIRKVRRAFRRANVRSALRSVGQDVESLVNEAEENLNAQNAVDQLRTILITQSQLQANP